MQSFHVFWKLCPSQTDKYVHHSSSLLSKWAHLWMPYLLMFMGCRSVQVTRQWTSLTHRILRGLISTHIFSNLFILVFKFVRMIMWTLGAGMLCIQEVAGLNLGLETNYPDSGFSWIFLSSSTHTHVRMVPQISPQPFPSMPFPINFSLISFHYGFGGLGVACWPLVPKFAGSNLAEAVGFLGQKNPQHAFLRRGSTAVGPMS